MLLCGADGVFVRFGREVELSRFRGQRPFARLDLAIAAQDADQADFLAEGAGQMDDIIDVGPEAMAAMHGDIDPLLAVGMAARPWAEPTSSMVSAGPQSGIDSGRSSKDADMGYSSYLSGHISLAGLPRHVELAARCSPFIRKLSGPSATLSSISMP